MHRAMKAALPGAYLVEIFPVMKHLPTWVAPWKKWGLEWHKKDTEMFQGFYDGVAKTLVSWKIRTRTRENAHEDHQREGDYKPSFTSSLIERQEAHRLSNHEAAWLAGAMLYDYFLSSPMALNVIVFQWGWFRHSACRALFRFSKN